MMIAVSSFQKYALALRDRIGSRLWPVKSTAIRHAGTLC